MFNGSSRFRIKITEIKRKRSTHSHVRREGTHFDLCPSPSSMWVRVPASVQMSCSRAGPPCPSGTGHGDTGRERVDLPCWVGQRGVGAAAPCTLHRGDALPVSV